MLKKFMVLLLSAVMVLSLAACGAKTEETKATQATEAPKAGETTATATVEVAPGSNKSASGETDKDVYIDIWGVYAQDNYRTEFIMEMADEFCKQYEAETGISVCIEYFNQDDYAGSATKLAAGAVSGNLPVLSQISSQNSPAFEDLCADLRDYMDADVLDNYLDGLMVGNYNKETGKVFGVPGGRSFGCYIVNMDLIEQAGYTEEDVKTWDYAKFHEIMAAVAALGDEYNGCALWWDTDAWMWESALYSNGGSIDNEDATQITFTENNAGAIFLDLVEEMVKDGSMLDLYIDMGYKEVGDAATVEFMTGNLACRMASITTYGGIKQQMAELPEDQQFNVVITNQPAGVGGFSMVTGGNNFLFLDGSTETQKQVAAAFLAFMAQDEYVAEWNQLSGYMAFTKSVYESEAYQKVLEDPNMAFLSEGIQYAHARANTLNWAEMRSEIMQGLDAFSRDIDGYKAEHGGSTTSIVQEWADMCQKIMDEHAND